MARTSRAVEIEYMENKKKAARRIINLDFSKRAAVLKFFKESGYGNKFGEGGM